ncbi:MAG: imidazole glycerol phosphate synthase subunit HisH [Bacteroidia bacterium]
MITIVDYGLGNLASIQNMLKRIGVRSEISPDPDHIRQAGKLILPGVGAFDQGMRYIHEKGLKTALDEAVLEKGNPILGICLGMQLLSRFSEEGHVAGLGWIQADTIRFQLGAGSERLRIPHMGWNTVHPQKTSALLEGYDEEPRFYFVHSYHVVCDDTADSLAAVDHGIRVTCAVERGNILGVQFHPEKSHKYGMRLLENFAKRY